MSVWYSHSIRDGMKPLCIEIIYDGRYPRDKTQAWERDGRREGAEEGSCPPTQLL